jgi:hypothetical protein
MPTRSWRGGATRPARTYVALTSFAMARFNGRFGREASRPRQCDAVTMLRASEVV